LWGWWLNVSNRPEEEDGRLQLLIDQEGREEEETEKDRAIRDIQEDLEYTKEVLIKTSQELTMRGERLESIEKKSEALMDGTYDWSEDLRWKNKHWIWHFLWSINVFYHCYNPCVAKAREAIRGHRRHLH
jgi:hypothetical protein